MNDAVIDSLNASRRDALTAYYLGHYVPEKLDDYKERLRTVEDMYEYLLIDPGVAPNVTTSRIAEAVASTQLYIHRCLEQLEPEVDETYIANESKPGGYFEYWDRYYKRYAIWAGLKRLLEYPSTYIDPTLRYRKTTPFQNLENTINQGRLTETRAEQAVAAYLNELEPLLQMQFVSGYQTEPSYLDSDLYFLGRTNTEPTIYYWRRVRGAMDGTFTHPLAWSEWHKIDMPLVDLFGEPSICCFEDRVCLVWLMRRQVNAKVINGQTTESIMEFRLGAATLSQDGYWRSRDYALKDLLGDYAHKNSDPDGIFSAELQYRNFSSELGIFIIYGEKLYLIIFNKYINQIHANNHDPRFLFKSVTQSDNGFDRNIYRINRPLMLLKISNINHPIKDINLIDMAGKVAITLNKTGNESTIKLAILNGDEELEKNTYPVKEGNNTLSFDFYFNDFVRLENPIIKLWDSFGFYANVIYILTGWENFDPNERLSVVDVDPDEHRRTLIVVTGDQLGGFACVYFSTSFFNIPIFNTLAAPFLHRQMQDGMDILLSWTTQHTNVDPSKIIGSNIVRPIDFEGGVGQYMWELFFHLPLLIANRLLTEQRFDEAEHWFKRLFNPAGYRDENGELDKDETGKVRYWNVRPLQENDAWNDVDLRTVDPDEIAIADPMHYKLAVYLHTLNLLLARGDACYRQLERDTLAEAKMWYVQALALLGTRPYIRESRSWYDPTLGETIADGSAKLREFEVQAASLTLQEPPTSHLLSPFWRQTDSPFKPPFNDELLMYWDRFESRLYNLRHNLSIDGQPLNLPLYATPVSPRDIQHMQSAGDSSGEFDSIGPTAPTQYRFQALLERARASAEMLRDFGGALLDILDRRDEEAMTVLQQTQADSLFNLILEGKQKAIDSLTKEHESVQAELQTVEVTARHYGNLILSGWSTEESLSVVSHGAGTLFTLMTAAPLAAAGALGLLPNIYGLAVGGSDLAAPCFVTGEILKLSAEVSHNIGDELAYSAELKRRSQEWGLARDQAHGEIKALENTIAALDDQIAEANKELELIQREQEHSAAILDELRTRFTSTELFDWMAGRLSTLYYQFYDSTVSLCRQAQASYRWETEDATSFIPTGAWKDLYAGLLAGEALLLGLQRMEIAYADWNTRALEVRKTLQLSKLAPDEDLKAAIANALGPSSKASTLHAHDGSFTVKYDSEKKILEIEFDLADFHIHQDYPPALNLSDRRLIKNVSVSLVGDENNQSVKPYSDVQALLVYMASSDTLPPGTNMMAISRATEDSGLFGRYELDFESERYYPFEGQPIEAGRFAMRFPNVGDDSDKQTAFVTNLEDIVIHLRYCII